MNTRTRATATLIAVAGLALSCTESTGIDTHRGNALQLPPGADRDVSKVAGTYVHPDAATSLLILLPTGSFTTQYESGNRTWALGGSFVRADSNLVFSFTGPIQTGFVMSGLVRGDTIFFAVPPALEDQVPLLHFTFVRMRER